ncbi:alpha/beta fold hydrolase [Psychrobacillus sp. NPDC058041]|uniref:alpha/beta fold hydrolase n=1 Tax=Psychrobacillus sp. NPDC058041 TaxID=3346310 RepID=UPI0036D8AF61
MKCLILHTSILGKGKPVVFLHTGLQTGLTDFEFQREYFSKNYQVFSPDLRGHGQSKTNYIQNFFEDCAKDLLETINYHNLKTIHLVGCSLGALVAIKFAKMYPERMNTLSISGIMPVRPSNWLEIHEQDVESQANVLNSQEVTNYFDQLHASDWKQFIYKGRDEGWYPFDDVNELKEFNFPVLFMVGEGNQNETIGATLLPRLNKNVHVAIIPFASHLVHINQPKIYTDVLEEFIIQFE